MIPRQAQYLLRFDDLCPTFSQRHWQRFLPLIEEFQIQPILAIVPANLDAELRCCEPDSAFWERMRYMEAAGATIGLHGYRHLCRNSGRSLVPLHRQTEFAGVRLEKQREWIEAGLAILRARGLNPRIWVAPRHGFDKNTLLALRSEGVGLVSDGLARVPFLRGGLTWIPQQLWSPIEKTEGLWTICVHTNTSSDSLPGELRRFLLKHAAQFTSIDRVIAEWRAGRLDAVERLRELAALWKIRISRLKRHERRELNQAGIIQSTFEL